MPQTLSEASGSYGIANHSEQHLQQWEPHGGEQYWHGTSSFNPGGANLSVPSTSGQEYMPHQAPAEPAEIAGKPRTMSSAAPAAPLQLQSQLAAPMPPALAPAPWYTESLLQQHEQRPWMPSMPGTQSLDWHALGSQPPEIQLLLEEAAAAELPGQQQQLQQAERLGQSLAAHFQPMNQFECLSLKVGVASTFLCMRQ